MPGDASKLVAVGLSHHTAPVDVRERLAFDDERVRLFLRHLRKEGVADEAFLISTCNRVELYAVPQDIERVRETMLAYRGPKGESIDPYLYWLRGRDVVAHLFKVTSALDSLVVGEPQILGQVKAAMQIAQEESALGRLLTPLAQRSLSVAKRVRTETEIGRSTVGIGNAGVDLALQIFGSLDGKRAMLLGTGEMGRQVGRALLNGGLAELIVASRTYNNAVELAKEHGGTPIAWERVEEYLPRVDIVIAATGATQPILTADMVKRALRARRWQSMFFIDLAVPRNIDARVAEVEEAYLFNVDDLERVVEQGRAARAAAAEQANQLVQDEADKFVKSLAEVQVGPALGKIAQHAEAIRAAELARSKKLLESLDPEQREQLDAMTKAMVKKLLDHPLRALRTAARDGDAEVAELIARLWDE